MASPTVDDHVLLVLKCVDHQEQTEYNPDQDDEEVTISTTDVYNWNFSSILQHRIVKIKTQKNRLIEHSSYFHGLLGGNFREDSDAEVLVQWDPPSFLSLLASLFGSSVDITSENFLSLFEGALYFGMQTIVSKCETWLTKATSVNRVHLVQLNDLINIWEFGSEIGNYLPELCARYLAENFIWAISCRSFGDIPYDLLLSVIKHPHLTVDSEKQLCDVLLVWIAANKQRCTEDVCINLLKQIRISLLPLWFAAGKKTHQSLSTPSYEIFCGALIVPKQPFTYRMNSFGDGDLLNLRIRLTEFTQRVDLSGCPQINPTILLLSTLPYSLIIDPLLRKRVDQLNTNLEPKLTFESVNEIDISNCPMLRLEIAMECFSKSFPFLKTLKAVNHLNFGMIKLLQLVKRCPLLCDVDLSVDASPVPVIPKGVVFDFDGLAFLFEQSYMSRPLSSNITKLTLDGRKDVNDQILESIYNTSVSLIYISLKGCTSVSDVGISSLIRECLSLNSIVACDTFFGQQSILALCSLNPFNNEKNNSRDSNLQMLHVGGCKGIDTTSSAFSMLISKAYTLTSLCLRETEVDDEILFNFVGSSLEALDVSNTKVSAAAVAHIIIRNPGIKCLKSRGCNNLIKSKNLYFHLGNSYRLDEISVGWGFSYSSFEVLKPAVSFLKAIEVGLGGSLGIYGLKCLPTFCPLLESVILYFQVISDDVIINMLQTLKHLKSLALCHCLGEISSSFFKIKMPNLRKLRLERVAPSMNNVDLVRLTRNCEKLTELSLVGCRLLNSESQKIISSGWPGLISISLEDCGEVTKNGVVSLLYCHALEDVLLRHNGSGIQRGFIGDAVMKLPMLRKLSLDACDAKDELFDIPEFKDRPFLSHVKIARCKSQKCAFDVQHVTATRSPRHEETLVLVWYSKKVTEKVIKDRI